MLVPSMSLLFNNTTEGVTLFGQIKEYPVSNWWLFGGLKKRNALF